jgi:hypothetical protein
VVYLTDKCLKIFLKEFKKRFKKQCIAANKEKVF